MMLLEGDSIKIEISSMSIVFMKDNVCTHFMFAKICKINSIMYLIFYVDGKKI